MVPLLVRAQTEDADGGEAYTRRLLTVAGVVLAVATLAAMATAPLLTRLYLGDGAGPANPQLATAFAWLLLPQIFFYGVGALLGALLNTRGVFAPFAWAPVLNNVVVLAVLGVFVAVPGRITLDPVQLSDPKLLVPGIGTTLGIVAQALVLIPAVRRTGFHYRPLWAGTGGSPRPAGWPSGRRVRPDRAGRLHRHHARRRGCRPGQRRDLLHRLAAPPGALRRPRRLAAHRADAADEPAAAEGRTADVVADLRLGTWLSAVVLLLVSVLLTLFGTQLGVGLFSMGAGSAGEGFDALGATLAASAFAAVRG